MAAAVAGIAVLAVVAGALVALREHRAEQRRKWLERRTRPGDRRRERTPDPRANP